VKCIELGLASQSVIVAMRAAGVSVKEHLIKRFLMFAGYFDDF